MPQAAEQIHGQDGLGSGADESGNARRAKDTLQEQMAIGVHSVEDDSNVWKELGNDVESTCSIILLVIRCSQEFSPRECFVKNPKIKGIDRSSPHTVHRTNSIVASRSRTRSKLIAIAL
jgi:hypothetical protein